ncbi:OmpH family outer membrane protein [Flavobacterium agricola]|uniref:OmpH family outer membrane protein n=1 Tax=Flavobacterium agricola TaxID=2870839 RepID=A0ABY6M006_9FLAO|nr:OmpH family outer membrane protein [Flavobacterium agricola]UYW00745.1 OmpH family outer membrane protein [Flavobacterium agricola]
MKTIKTLFIAAVMFLGANQAMQAQSKIAHINVQELVTNLPDMKNAEAQIRKIAENYDKEYTTMATEYQTKMGKYESEAKNVTDAVNESRMREMEEMGQRIQAFQADAQKQLQQKQQDLLKPVLEKAQAAIAKVGKAKGFQYVLDSSIGAGVLYADGNDILADVKKELGVK